MIKDDNYFMTRALARAKAAAAAGEVPIGAVIVRDGEIIATGRNMRESKHNALHHAEVIAIDRACKRLKAWRLSGCTLYVTVEPCPMCAGAIINSRISRLVFGCYDYKAGVYGSVFNIRDHSFNHYYDVTAGVMERECAKAMSDFFADLRKKTKAEKELAK